MLTCRCSCTSDASISWCVQRGFRQRTAQRQRQRQLAVRAAGSCALSLTIDWFRGIHESVVDVVLYSKTQKLERCIELKLVASWSDCPLRDSWLLVLSLSLHDLPSHWCTQNRNGLVPEARHGTVLQNSFCHGAGSSTRTVCVWHHVSLDVASSQMYFSHCHGSSQGHQQWVSTCQNTDCAGKSWETIWYMNR